MSRWARNPVVTSLALLVAGVLLAAVATAVNAAYDPVEPPGGGDGFRWWIDIPVPVAGALVVIGGAVAWWWLIRRRPPGRAGRWGFWIAVAAALFQPLIVVPTYLIWRAAVDEMPGDWGGPFELIWVAMCLAAMGLGIASARRDPSRWGLLLLPAVVAVFVVTFALAVVIVPR